MGFFILQVLMGVGVGFAVSSLEWWQILLVCVCTFISGLAHRISVRSEYE
jgi:hypothetical protein